MCVCVCVCVCGGRRLFCLRDVICIGAVNIVYITFVYIYVYNMDFGAAGSCVRACGGDSRLVAMAYVFALHVLVYYKLIYIYNIKLICTSTQKSRCIIQQHGARVHVYIVSVVNVHVYIMGQQYSYCEG